MSKNYEFKCDTICIQELHIDQFYKLKSKKYDDVVNIKFIL